jgi:hypothetical protein
MSLSEIEIDLFELNQDVTGTNIHLCTITTFYNNTYGEFEITVGSALIA